MNCLNKKTILYLFCISCIFSCETNENTSKGLETILIDLNDLEKKKTAFLEDTVTVEPAFKQLMNDANKALKRGPYSVVNKKKLAPSKDKHDYVSYSRYWWPDTTKVDGLPYLRRDGETNPASQDLDTSDRPRLGLFTSDVLTLGLAYFYTEELKYAEKAAELLRVWFLNPDTKMNPHLNHSQCRLGHNNGSKSGVLDGRLLVNALEGSLLIGDANLLSKVEMKGLKAWAKEYFTWLISNEMALDEAASKNNHGTFYDVQSAYFAIYADQKDEARRILQQFYHKRLESQILLDGSMPEELARTRPIFYSLYNLYAMCMGAHLAEKLDIDLWKSKELDSRISMAIDYVIPYVTEEIKWQGPTVGTLNKMDVYPIILLADQQFPEKDYRTHIDLLDKIEIDKHWSQLAIPIMK